MILFALSVAMSPKFMSAQRDDRAAIESIEREWLAHESDQATLEQILAPDFAHPVSAGVMLTKQQHIDWAVHHPKPGDSVSRFLTLKIRIYGNVAIANGIVEQTRAGGDASRTIFTDVFVYRDSKWQAVNAQENAIGNPVKTPHS